MSSASSPHRCTAVLKGGMSAERPISLKTGAAVAAALRERGHEVVELDVSPDLPRSLAEANVCRAFVALHGRFGEDGCIQGMLELMRVPYTGSSVAACALTMDKLATKGRLRQLGLPTAEWLSLTAADEAAEAPPFGFPAVVKAPLEGSSIGIYLVHDSAAYRDAVTAALAHGTEVLVEPFLRGVELTVAVLDGVALPVVEIEPLDGWFDFTNKYTKGRTQYHVPARVEPSLAAQVQELAVRSYAGCGCSGVARVDFICPEGGTPQILEINTIPGMTETSLVPMAAELAGMDFSDLCERLVEGARLHVQMPSPSGGA